MMRGSIYDDWDDLAARFEEHNRLEREVELSNRYYLGLDLGRAQDYTAPAILERQGEGAEAVLHCRHLERWPLQTPYPQIAADVVKMVRDPQLSAGNQSRPYLTVDATGVGAPVVDLLRKALQAPACPQVQAAEINLYGGRSRMLTEPPRVRRRAIQITGGDTVTEDGDLYRVPERDLVSTAQVALQTERLKIAPGLELSQVLAHEMQNFQVKITDAANDVYGAWREGQHDDLVLAVALALYVGQKRGVPVTPGSYSFRSY